MTTRDMTQNQTIERGRANCAVFRKYVFLKGVGKDAQRSTQTDAGGTRLDIDISAELNHTSKGLHGAPDALPFVFWNKMIRLFQVGRFLFTTAIVGIILCHYFTGVWLRSPDAGIFTQILLFIGAYSGCVLPLFAVLDAGSRFQDYKKAKDLFFKNGFKPKIANLFIHSKCQRDAVKVAARDLGLETQLDQYYLNKGYRWYHILPTIALKRPGLLFTVGYWKKTLFAPRYASRYFLW